MPRRFLGTVVVMCALALVCATSAAAFEVSFDGEVLRYRGQPLERFWVEVKRRPSNLLIEAFRYRFEDPMPSVRPGPGCHRAASEWWKFVVHCPLPSAHSQPRYRFIPADTEVWFFGDLRGVVYAGSGRDSVIGGDRVYGGAGFDELGGTRVYGGPGNDHLFANDGAPDTPVQRGGPGNDRLEVPGMLYGGPGADDLSDTPFEGEESADMLVGGPGQDTVRVASDGRNDVVRVRGGGIDRVHCRRHADPGDALFVDRTHRLTAGCEDATVLFTERPRYPYP